MTDKTKKPTDLDKTKEVQETVDDSTRKEIGEVIENGPRSIRGSTEEVDIILDLVEEGKRFLGGYDTLKKLDYELELTGTELEKAKKWFMREFIAGNFETAGEIELKLFGRNVNTPELMAEGVDEMLAHSIEFDHPDTLLNANKHGIVLMEIPGFPDKIKHHVYKLWLEHKDIINFFSLAKFFINPEKPLPKEYETAVKQELSVLFFTGFFHRAGEILDWMAADLSIDDIRGAEKAIMQELSKGELFESKDGSFVFKTFIEHKCFKKMNGYPELVEVGAKSNKEAALYFWDHAEEYEDLPNFNLILSEVFPSAENMIAQALDVYLNDEGREEDLSMLKNNFFTKGNNIIDKYTIKKFKGLLAYATHKILTDKVLYVLKSFGVYGRTSEEKIENLTPDQKKELARKTGEFKEEIKVKILAIASPALIEAYQAQEGGEGVDWLTQEAA